MLTTMLALGAILAQGLQGQYVGALLTAAGLMGLVAILMALEDLRD